MAQRQRHLPQKSSINLEDLKDLMKSLRTRACERGNQVYQKNFNCFITLMKRDYTPFLVERCKGSFNNYYSGHLPIIENEIKCKQNIGPAQGVTKTTYQKLFNVSQICELLYKATSTSRLIRFPVPVILYNGKYICRFAAFAGDEKQYVRTGLDYLIHGNDLADCTACNDDCAAEKFESFLQLSNKLHTLNNGVLNIFKTETIVHLMVEKSVTTSENINGQQPNSNFSGIGLPYPGCAFFEQFDKTNIDELLHYCWNPPEYETPLSIPNSPDLSYLGIPWEKNADWDLLTLTKNYMRYLLKYFQDSNSGMTVHCSNGWDRTPMFVSLLRLSLWADGLVHKSLDENEILYFTLSYDWMLFNRHPPSTLKKTENILVFSFFFLKFLGEQEYSIAPSSDINVSNTKHTKSPAVNRTISWQRVTSSGSGTGSNSLSGQSTSSSSSVTAEDGSRKSARSTIKRRKERLLRVSSIFHHVYWQTVNDIPPLGLEATASGVEAHNKE